MILLNFSHPLTPEQLAQLEAMVGCPILRAIARMPHFDEQQPFEPQLAGCWTRSSSRQSSGRPNQSWSSSLL